MDDFTNNLRYTHDLPPTKESFYSPIWNDVKMHIYIRWGNTRTFVNKWTEKRCLGCDARIYIGERCGVIRDGDDGIYETHCMDCIENYGDRGTVVPKPDHTPRHTLKKRTQQSND